MFGPEISEEYERVRDRIENGITAMQATMVDVRWFAKIVAGALVVIAGALVVIAIETVLG